MVKVVGEHHKLRNLLLARFDLDGRFHGQLIELRAGPTTFIKSYHVKAALMVGVWRYTEFQRMTHVDSGFQCFREAWEDCKVLQGHQWRRVYSGSDWLTQKSFSNRKFRIYIDRSFITNAFLKSQRVLKISRTTGAIKNYADQYPDCQIW